MSALRANWNLFGVIVPCDLASTTFDRCEAVAQMAELPSSMWPVVHTDQSQFISLTGHIIGNEQSIRMYANSLGPSHQQIVWCWLPRTAGTVANLCMAVHLVCRLSELCHLHGASHYLHCHAIVKGTFVLRHTLPLALAAHQGSSMPVTYQGRPLSCLMSQSMSLF